MSAQAVNRLVEKACTSCGEVKPLGLFSAHPRTRDGRKSWCKQCMADHNAQRRAATNYNYERAHSKATRRAVRMLIEAHRDEYDRLKDEAMRAEGLR